jgi:hypothetical protein
LNEPAAGTYRAPVHLGGGGGAIQTAERKGG